MYKQIIIARKDLDMSPGKLGSIGVACFNGISAQSYKKNAEIVNSSEDGSGYQYKSTLSFDSELFEEWILGAFTKVVLGARNKNQLLKAIEMAKEQGWKKERSSFLSKTTVIRN